MRHVEFRLWVRVDTDEPARGWHEEGEWMATLAQAAARAIEDQVRPDRVQVRVLSWDPREAT